MDCHLPEYVHSTNQNLSCLLDRGSPSEVVLLDWTPLAQPSLVALAIRQRATDACEHGYLLNPRTTVEAGP